MGLGLWTSLENYETRIQCKSGDSGLSGADDALFLSQRAAVFIDFILHRNNGSADDALSAPCSKIHKRRWFISLIFGRLG